MWAFLADSAAWALASYWPAIFAVSAVVFVGIRFPEYLAKVLILAALATFALSLGAALREAEVPANNRLMRDVVAFAVLGALSPLAAYCAVLLCQQRAAWIRVAVPVLAGIVPIVLSPIVLLIVHCTSGDCL